MRIDIVGKVFAVREEVAFAMRMMSMGDEVPRLSLEAASRMEAAAKMPSRRSGQIAVFPFFGFVTQRGGMMSEYYGDAPLELYQHRLGEAAADPDVKGIVTEFDSPGGEVYGVPETAALLRAVSAQKPVVAVANSVSASAAYWLASQSDELLVTPSGEVGSIGVYGMHADMSGALEQMGVKVTLVSAGKYKTEGNRFEPLSADALESMQESVNRYYGMFVADVAKGRGVSVESVRTGYGEGRMVGAKQAVSMGMADGIGGLADGIRRAASLASGRAADAASRASAQADVYRIERA